MTGKKKQDQIISDVKQNINWKELFHSKWVFPFALIVLMIIFLSLRMLSDPDTGFHLKTGKWIIENHSFPQKDTYTYTANNNNYIDLHWFFQIFTYFIYSLFGYIGLSLQVMFTSILLLFLLLKRNKLQNIPLKITCIVLLFGYLIIEPRLLLRPEIFSFLYIVIILIILDLYFHSHKNFLFFLPIIMLFWVNTHGLFILGIVLIGSYFISLWIKEKKIDKKFFIWSSLSLLICFFNPYFIKGILFPFELFTRFKSNNVFNQHILEFKSFGSVVKYDFTDYLFIFFSLLTFVLSLRYAKKKNIHDFIILFVFFYLAYISIRNIPLFVIVAIPIFSSSLYELFVRIKEKKWYLKMKFFRHMNFVFFILLPVALIFRIYTGAYYISNKSYSKFGVGIDKQQQPYSATTFLINNKLDGKIINSLGYGGWLAWNLPQPIFIDGRLEVMKEQLYMEVTDSWNGRLSKLIDKYKPKLIIYNYLKYYTWTTQLNKMPQWRIIYLDGEAVIFASSDYATNISALNMVNLPIQYDLPKDTSVELIKQILNISPLTKINNWTEGFYKKHDYSCDDLTNIASFCLQFKEYNLAEQFFLESIRKSKGKNNFVYYALADIYKKKGNQILFQICLSKINKNKKD